MKLLINMSNNIGGGSLQVGLSFIRECKNFRTHSYVIVYNSSLSSLFNFNEYEANFKFIEVQPQKFWNLAGVMTKIEKKENPDVVFTIFGPSYWRPRVKHVVGFANPYYYQMEAIFKKRMSRKQYFLIRIKKLIHTIYMNIDTDVLITETDYTTESYLKLFKKIKKGFTVSNTCSDYYTDFMKKKKYKVDDEISTFRLLMLSKYYKHKNFEIIKEISLILQNRNINNIEFWITIDDKNYQRLFANNSYVINKGVTKPQNCPSLYYDVDAMFLPTLAECFSASYPEAMIMEKPILTSDLPFARSVCKEAALYFEPLNANDIVNKILLLSKNENLRKKLIDDGKRVFSAIPTAKERAIEYLNICNSCI